MHTLNYSNSKLNLTKCKMDAKFNFFFPIFSRTSGSDKNGQYSILTIFLSIRMSSTGILKSAKENSSLFRSSTTSNTLVSTSIGGLLLDHPWKGKQIYSCIATSVHLELHLSLCVPPNYSIIICRITKFSFFLKRFNLFFMCDEIEMHKDVDILRCTQILLFSKMTFSISILFWNLGRVS